MAVPKKKRYTSPRQFGLLPNKNIANACSLTYKHNYNIPKIINLLPKNSIYCKFIKLINLYK